MTEEELRDECLSKFPTIFQNALNNNSRIREKFLNKVHKEYEELPVYRGLRYEDNVIDNDFKSYNELRILNNEKINENSLEWYSVSVNEDLEQLINVLDIPSEEKQIYGIAKGIMKCKYGPADFSGKKTHHNWYLYDNVIPYLKQEFEIVKITENKSEKYDE